LTIRNRFGHIVHQSTRSDTNFVIDPVTSAGEGRAEPRWLSAVINLPFLGETVVPIPFPMDPSGVYTSGIYLSGDVLANLGAGTFTIEIRNNHNIAFTTLTIA